MKPALLALADGTVFEGRALGYEGETVGQVPGVVTATKNNGFGGLGPDGDYHVRVQGDAVPPAPWSNVIANPHFGFQIAADGGGYTWSINSRENQLTQWCNDPVTDRPGEVLYVRDEDTGELWGPCAAPVRDESAPYHARHGQGYSSFQHHSHEIDLDLLLYVPLEASIKISRLRILNTSARRRHLCVTAYIEGVLGTSRGASAPFVVTEIDTRTGAMFARNPWNSQFASRVAFADLAGRQTKARAVVDPALVDEGHPVRYALGHRAAGRHDRPAGGGGPPRQHRRRPEARARYGSGSPAPRPAGRVFASGGRRQRARPHAGPQSRRRRCAGS